MKKNLYITSFLFIFIFSFTSVDAADVGDGPVVFQEETLQIAGQDIAPYYYLDKKGEINGFFFQITKNVCEQEKLKCNFIILPFRRVQQYISTGDIHITAPMAKTLEREMTLDFSEIVLSSGYEFFGKAEYIKSIKSINSINTNIGVHSPSATYTTLLSVQKQYNLDLRIKQETDVAMVFDKLARGRYDLVFMNKDISSMWIKETKNKEKFISYQDFSSPIDYRLAYTKKTKFAKDDALLKKFKKGLEKFVKTKKFIELKNGLKAIH